MSIELRHGDCLEVMRGLPDKSVDLFLCDLPYGCLTGSPKVKGCAWDQKLDLAAFWAEVERLAKSDHTPVIHFCTVRFGHELIASKPEWFRYDLVWNKGRGVSFLLANKMPLRSHEMIYVFSKKGAFYRRLDVETDRGGYRNARRGRSTIYTAEHAPGEREGGERCVLSVIDHHGRERRGGHPTEKPMDIYRWLIERYSPVGGVVLDPTAGSFNSCFAAYELDREAIGIEKDEGFFQAACLRADAL